MASTVYETEICTGDILDVFHAFGKMFWSMHSFIMLVSGEVIYSVTSLIYLEGIRSGPVAQSISSDVFYLTLNFFKGDLT